MHATISDDGYYRYTLERRWSDRPSRLLWIMLNPSTADALKDDPTIRRCCGFAKALGYGGILVGNLYALRATNPKALRAPPFGIDAVGPDNDYWLRHLAGMAQQIICAWGHPGPDGGRWKAVCQCLRDKPLYAMGFTKLSRMPRHPLMLPKETQPVMWFSSNQSAEQK